MSITELIDYFNNNLLHNIENYHSINEVLEYFNLPLFHEFDFKNKYVKYEYENKIFIKLLFKDINEWDKILSEIFNKKITIYKNNLSEDKKYYNTYINFLDEYKIPKHFFDYYLKNDREFVIYNTKNEQEEYVKKWLIKSY